MLQETTGNYIQPKYRITQNEIFVQRQNHEKEQKLMVRLRLADRGGLKLTACTFFNSIIRMEVLSLCFDVEPLPNDGLGPGQLLPHQSEPKQDQNWAELKYTVKIEVLVRGRLPCSWLESHLSSSQCFLMQLQGWLLPSQNLQILLLPSYLFRNGSVSWRKRDNRFFFFPFHPLFGRFHTMG
jgi:hypothetical protein